MVKNKIAFSYDYGSRIPGARAGAVLYSNMSKFSIDVFDDKISSASYVEEVTIRTKELVGKRKIIIGGDHSLTYYTYKAFSQEECLLVYFDGHNDEAEDSLMVTNWNFVTKLNCPKIHVKKDVTIRELEIINSYPAIYISIDLDYIDSKWMKCVSYPVETGNEVVDLMKNLMKIDKEKIIAVDIMEFNPMVGEISDIEETIELMDGIVRYFDE